MADIEAQAAKDKAVSERNEKDRILGKDKSTDESDEKNKQQLGRTDIEGLYSHYFL